MGGFEMQFPITFVGMAGNRSIDVTRTKPVGLKGLLLGDPVSYSVLWRFGTYLPHMFAASPIGRMRAVMIYASSWFRNASRLCQPRLKRVYFCIR